MKIVEDLERLFRERGNSLYFGEAVTETQHALQSADLALRSGASDTAICAALLHDVGHLLHDLGEDAAERGQDDLHEARGYKWLKQYFPAAVVDPIRLHVAAKRYLCTIDPNYHRDLSHASQLSLKLQGGMMSDTEKAAFEAEPHFQTAILVRRWDDEAKDPQRTVPDFTMYRDRLQKLAGDAGDKA